VGGLEFHYGRLTNAILRAIEVLVEREEAIIWIAVRQRARLEHWLKLELAYELEKMGFRQVALEESYRRGKRADVAFDVDGGRGYLELKTCATNWAVEGVPLATSRPITNEVASFLKDVESVKSIRRPNLGMALMLLLPARLRDDIISRIRAWRKYGDELLSERPLVRMLKLKDEVGIAVLLFGPYQDGKLVRGPEGLGNLLSGLRFEEEEIEEARKLLRVPQGA